MEDFEKKYNEVLDRAKHALETDLHESGHWAVKYIFPELKESQDKKICKALISVLESDFEKDNTINGISVAEIIDWLKDKNNDGDGSRVPYTAEIQTGDGGVVTVVNGEVTMTMPKFKVGDWVVFGNNLNGNSIYHIEKIENYHYTLRHILGGLLPLPFGNESHIRPWTLDDAKDGDVLIDKYNNIGIFKECKNIYWLSHIYLGCDGELMGFNIGGYHEQTDTHPTTKDQRDLLFSKMEEAGYKWDDENKEIVAIKLTPKFKVGDWIVNNISNNVFLIKSINNGYCTLEDIKGNKISPCLPPCESESHIWTIQDAKDGDVLAIDWIDDFSNVWEKIVVFKSLSKNGVEGYGCTFKNKEKVFDINVPFYSKTWTKNLHPATKEQRDLLFKEMKEAGYKWDDKKKEIVAIKLTPKFKVGDWVVNNNSGGVYQVKEIRDDEYCLWPLDAEIQGYFRIIDVDTDYHFWTINDAKDGGILVASDGSIFIFKEVCDTGCKHYVAFAKNDTIQVNYNLEHFWESSRGVHPATKEQRDLLFAKMKEAGYEWNDDKRELEKIEQKSDARNEEDNMWIEYFNRLLSYAYIKNSLALHNGTEEFRDFGNSPIGAKKWLDGLKDRFRNSN